jgi:hypothetical protein
MNSWARTAAMRIAAGMVLAIFVWGFVAPPSASASCGDYVVMAPQHAPESPSWPQTPLTSFSLTLVLPPCACLPAIPRDRLPAPCPGCSAPTPSDSAAVPVTVQPIDHGAIPSSAVALPAGDPSSWLPDYPSAPSSCLLFGIFRPPR